MRTDTIIVSSNGFGTDRAMLESQKYAGYLGLNEKQSLRLRLLTEETLGMVSAIAGDFSADFWIQSYKTNGCEIHLAAKVEMNYEKRKDLLAVSSSGVNEASKGFMGKIREMIENSFYTCEEIETLSEEYGGGTLSYAAMGLPDVDMMDRNAYEWTLQRYRKSVDEARETNKAAVEAWDELEKSIVAKLADDVKVSIIGNNIEVIIIKEEF